MEYYIENYYILKRTKNKIYSRPQLKKKEKLFQNLDLILWNLMNKLPIRRCFPHFIKKCPKCGRLRSETLIGYYTGEEVSCKRCKVYAFTFSTLINTSLNLAAKTLKMEKNIFKRILKESPALRRLVLSYMEGISIHGLRVPQVPSGPLITLWSITHRCNLNCAHCYVPQNNGMKELNYSEVCKVIDQLHEAKNFVIGFSGGEALLREDIYDIIHYASKKEMSIALATNGTLITKDVARNLKESGLGYAQISIDGLKEVHDQIRGRGMFNKAIQGIKNAIEAGLYVSMDVVITRLNVHQIDNLIELAKDLGVSKFEILDFVPSEKAAGVSEIALNPLEMEQFGKKVCEIWHDLIINKYPLTLSYKNPIFTRILAQRYPKITYIPYFKGIFPKDAMNFFNFSDRLTKGVFGEQKPFSPFITGCESGIYVIHIKPNGDVTPCPLNPALLGNVQRTHIQSIWRNSPILNVYRDLKFKGACGKCLYKTICGGCRAKVFLNSDSFDQSDPTCILNCKMKKSNQ